MLTSRIMTGRSPRAYPPVIADEKSLQNVATMSPRSMVVRCRAACATSLQLISGRCLSPAFTSTCVAQRDALNVNEVQAPHVLHLFLTPGATSLLSTASPKMWWCDSMNLLCCLLHGRFFNGGSSALCIQAEHCSVKKLFATCCDLSSRDMSVNDNL